MVGIGVSVAFITGTVLTWRVLDLTVFAGLIPCVILLVGLSLFPESPRWLVKKGREKEFESTLQKLRGKAVDSSYEAAEIKIVVGLLVLQQLGGTNAFCFYASHTFESAGKSSLLKIPFKGKSPYMNMGRKHHILSLVKQIKKSVSITVV
ncbi:hypothetical protein Peur_021944 [Populus x canadensis]